MSATIESNHQELTALREENATLRSRVADYEREIEKLQVQVVRANKHLFGKTSERVVPDDRQEPLFSFPEGSAALVEPETVTIPEHQRAKRRGRKPLPEALPREVIIHEPAETHCATCQRELVEISREKTEILESVPARLYVQEHVKVSKACPCCKDGVHSGKLPGGVQPLERSRPGPGLLADIIVSKYCDHLPLHRQEEIFLRKGISLPRQRMCDWIGEVVELFTPLYRALLREVLSSPYVQADETQIDVQDREVEGNITRGYFWGIHKPPDLVYFHYADTRSQEVPKELFKDYRGVVQTDLYAGYGPIYLPDRCTRLACLAHVRRKFVEVEALAKRECQQALTLIGRLYKVESGLRNKEPAERLAVRERQARPILAELHTFLRSWKERSMPRSLVVSAIDYALQQWGAIQLFLTDGSFLIDNNGIERQIRPIAVGRHNWLFAGSHDGARRAAVLYSLLNSCKLNKVNPLNYMRDIIARVGDHKICDIANLLPHRWTPKA